MNFPLMREFRLSGNGSGVSCDANGAFVGAIPLLKRITSAGDREIWAPRDAGELSDALSASYGLPVDVSQKSGGLGAIARALNSGNVARAQIATLLLQMPDPPPLAKNTLSQSEIIKLVVSLECSGLLKMNSNHYPAGTPGSKGGQFAPKGTQSGAPAQAGDKNDQDDPTDNLNLLDRPDREKIGAVDDAKTTGEGAAEAGSALESAEADEAAAAAERAALRAVYTEAEHKALQLAARQALRTAAFEALKAGSKLALDAIPLVGVAADISTVYDVYKMYEAYHKFRIFVDATTDFVNAGPRTLQSLLRSPDSLQFKNFGQFVKAYLLRQIEEELEKRFGPAGTGYQYHHIIEQGAAGDDITENTDNIVRIPAILHEAINGIYQETEPQFGDKSLRVWLETQPNSVKRERGLKVLRDVGIIK